MLAGGQYQEAKTEVNEDDVHLPPMSIDDLKSPTAQSNPPKAIGAPIAPVPKAQIR
jgi:hypothetical protein